MNRCTKAPPPNAIIPFTRLQLNYLRASPFLHFLAISSALLGTGSGALLVYLAKPLDKDKLKHRQMLLWLSFPSLLSFPSGPFCRSSLFRGRSRTQTRGMVQKNLSFLEWVTMLQKNPELFKTWKL